MPALAIAEDRVGGFNLQDLPPDASSRSPANGSAYAARPTYTFDLASGEVLNQDARTLAATPPRPARVPALLLYEEYHPYGTNTATHPGANLPGRRRPPDPTSRELTGEDLLAILDAEARRDEPHRGGR